MKKVLLQLWGNSKELATTITGISLVAICIALYIKGLVGLDVILIFMPCPIGLIFSKDSFFMRTKKKKNVSK